MSDWPKTADQSGRVTDWGQVVADMSTAARWLLEQKDARIADLEALLLEAEKTLMECAKAALTVKPTLDVPYPDDQRWTPWTRWVERAAHTAHDVAIRIRKANLDAGPLGAEP